MCSISDFDRSMPILVVDSLSTMRKVLKNCLKELGFENVTEVEDPGQALERLRSQQFQFMISSWQLDGERLLRFVRNDARLKEIPVLFVIPATQKTIAAKSAEDAASDVIVKPFTAEVLKLKMESAYDRATVAAP